MIYTQKNQSLTQDRPPLSQHRSILFLMVPFCERHNDDEVFSFVVSRSSLVFRFLFTLGYSPTRQFWLKNVISPDMQMRFIWDTEKMLHTRSRWDLYIMLHGYMRSLYPMTKRLNVAAYGSTNGLHICQLGHTWTRVVMKKEEKKVFV